MDILKFLLKFLFIASVIVLDCFVIFFSWIFLALGFFTITPVFSLISMFFIFIELNRGMVKVFQANTRKYNEEYDEDLKNSQGKFRKFWLGLGFVSIIWVIFAAIRLEYQERISYYSEGRYDEELYRNYEPFKSGNRFYPSNLLYFTEPNPPVIDGAKALYPVYAAFAEKIYYIEVIGETKCYTNQHNRDYWLSHSKKRIIVDCRNTKQAFDNLLTGNNDIVFLAHPSKEQMQKAEKRGIKLRLTPIGKEAFVFFVNKRNPVNNLSTQELKDIYSGKIRYWRKVGGSWWQNIRAFQRVKNSGSQAAMEKFMGDTPLMPKPSFNTIGGMGEIINKVAEYRHHSNSIGYSFLFFVETLHPSKDIKILSVDGIYPTKENIKNGKYPLTYPFYAITLEGLEDKNTLAFLDWLKTEEAKEIIEKVGYTAYEKK